jgi:molecular chaperone HtpG
MEARVTVSEKAEFGFQAEIKQLLHLLSHSLYQSREIAIRELISNASDALDRMRHRSLIDEAFREPGPLEIRLTGDKQAKTLVIADTGIGMTRDELVRNLGTIARSGTLEYLNNLAEERKKDINFIGQFGVGFYAAFMLAECVTVHSRGADAAEAWLWSSDGSGSFTVEPGEPRERGTTITLHLRDDALDYAESWRLSGIVKRYSGFVTHPVLVDGAQANTVRPIWVEPRSKLTDEDYVGFYRHLSHSDEETPLWWLHASVDSPIQFHAVLYCPSSNHELLGFHKLDHGLSLCARRILVQSDNRELLPEYLRFLHGLVDSEDLPLNVSRESLQDNTVFRKIRTVLVKRTLDRIGQFADEKPDDYRTFFEQFGTILKEGVPTDRDNRDRVAKLLRFRSTRTEGETDTVSLDGYLARIQGDQSQIYYLGGTDAAALANNPNLEIFRRRGIEVLLLTDPIDEFVMDSLREWQGKRLISIDSADVQLPVGAEPVVSAAQAGELSGLISLLKGSLSDEVADVRVSHRLTDSPACLVNPEGALSNQMQRILKAANRETGGGKRILELNPEHDLVRRLAQLSSSPEQRAFVELCGAQMLANAMLLEGLTTKPQDTVARVQTLMAEAASKRSTIITA